MAGSAIRQAGAYRNRNLFGIIIREASPDDLASVNGVIRSAIMSWSIPDRVKRLSLPIYSYSLQDMKHLSMYVGEDETGIVGVATCEPAHDSETPIRKMGVLLHGIYVRSDRHRQGVGTQLLCEVRRHARRCDADGLLVKAHSEACGFFSAQGLRMLPVIDSDRDYPYRYWTERLSARCG
jgi:GNAT superfamily N-acetyltransferase